MIQAKDFRKLPKESLIFPELIPMVIPDFHKHSDPILPNVLSFERIDSEVWFNNFADLIEGKIGKEFFPVMRMSDGEFMFLLGQVYPYYEGHKIIAFLKKVIITSKERFFTKNSFNAATLPGVSSGNYTQVEITNQRKEIVEKIKFLSEQGILALHLTYSNKPFQEHFHKKLYLWFAENHIKIHHKNYFPFYFVYALLRGKQKRRILENKTVLIFHSAKDRKQEQIMQSLLAEGVRKVIWHEISSNRSMFDTITLEAGYFDADIAFIGAGVGKFNILAQLETLQIPCIDAGYVFEVWADEENKWKRPMMVPDEEWDYSRIKF